MKLRGQRSWNTTDTLEIELEKIGDDWKVMDRRYPTIITRHNSDGTLNPVYSLLGEGEFVVLEMEVHAEGYHAPANLSGHPDNWYPEEGEDERTLESLTIRYFDDEGDEIEEELEVEDEVFPFFEQELSDEIDNMEVA